MGLARFNPCQPCCTSLCPCPDDIDLSSYDTLYLTVATETILPNDAPCWLTTYTLTKSGNSWTDGFTTITCDDNILTLVSIDLDDVEITDFYCGEDFILGIWNDGLSNLIYNVSTSPIINTEICSNGDVSNLPTTLFASFFNTSSCSCIVGSATLTLSGNSWTGTYNYTCSASPVEFLITLKYQYIYTSSPVGYRPIWGLRINVSTSPTVCVFCRSDSTGSYNNSCDAPSPGFSITFVGFVGQPCPSGSTICDSTSGIFAVVISE